MSATQRIVRVRRQYNQWVADQSLEDYALRFTGYVARRWSHFAASEWDGGFRDDIASFLDDALIDAAIMHDRPLELPPRSHPYFYRAFTDSAGGTGRDAYTLAIAHKEGERYVIDVVRGTR